MCDHTIRPGRKHDCCYYLQAISTEEILKRHIKNWVLKKRVLHEQISNTCCLQLLLSTILC